MIHYYKNIPTNCVRELGFLKRAFNFWFTWPVISWHIAKFLVTRDNRRKITLVKALFLPGIYLFVLLPCFTMYTTEYCFRMRKDRERIDTMIGFTLTGYVSFFTMKKQIAVFRFENPSWGKEEDDLNTEPA